MTCTQCGRENPEGARFCNACGAALETVSARETRKTVTVLFCDIAGYTEAGERLDPEALRKLQSRYFDDAREALERHGGTVEKFIGDAVMAVFGVPRVHEDDALRAARAAVELRAAIGELGLKARIGINTGEVVAGSGDALVTGDAVNVAARLEQAAEPGVILIGDATHRLVSDAVTSELVGPLEAKGKAEPLRAWSVLELNAGPDAVQRRLDSPMVGRGRERAVLRQAFERAVEERACHLFTVLGAAGVGKSRLVAELCSELAGAATIATGRCLPYGDGITFWPLYEILDELGERSREVRNKLDTAASSPEELFLSVRRLFEETARARPLVLVLDDVHWAEPTFLDFVDHVSDWSRDAPILLVCMARPELLDERPGWGGGKLNATSVLLEPLPEDECDALITNLLGEAELAADVRARILEGAEGNPLFVEEMLEMLIDDGLLARRNGSWVATVDLSGISVPPTIQALLAARLDRLSSEERAVAERAAVEGKLFHRGAVTALASSELKSEVSTHLLSLVRKELVRPDEGDFADEDAFRFRHLLLRDAAYESLPKEVRAELHERFADWLEAKVGEGTAGYEEIVGYHLEQASLFHEELGTRDETLARRAAQRLASAGRRAQARADIPAAVTLFERAAGLLPAGDAERVGILPPLGAVLLEQGEFARATEILREAIERAEALGDRRSGALAQLHLTHVTLQTSSDSRFRDALDSAREIAATFEELGDDLAATAWRYVSLFEFFDCQCERAEKAYERSVEIERRSGTRSRTVPWWAIAAKMYGPTPAAEAERRVRELTDAARGDRYAEGMGLLALALFAAMQERSDEARRLRMSAKEVIEELGSPLRLAGTSMVFGVIDDLLGAEGDGEREIRAGYELCLELGETGYLSTLAGCLGEAVYADGRLDEALALSEESERIGAADDLSTQVLWRRLRAKVLGRRGKLDEAEALARAAVDLARRTDYLDETAQTLRSLAEVLESAGETEEARACLTEALELNERKGDTVSAGRVRRQLQALEAE